MLSICCLSCRPLARSSVVRRSFNSQDRIFVKSKLAISKQVVGVKMFDDLAVDDVFSSFADS